LYSGHHDGFAFALSSPSFVRSPSRTVRIAFVVEHFSPQQGGAEQYAWGLARWLAEAGHTLEVFALRAAAGVDFARALHLRDLPAGWGPSRLERMARVFDAALEGASYDVVQGFNHVRSGDVLCLGGGVHRAFERCSAMSAPGALARAVRAWSYRLLPRYGARRRNEARQFEDPHRRFIAVSRRVAADMSRHYPSCANRVRLIYPGVDLGRFNPEEAAARRRGARLRFSLSDRTTALLFVSNNYRLKGLHDLIRALPEARRRLGGGPLKLLVVGRGRAGPFTRLAAAAGVGGDVVFAGAVDDPRDAYAAADVLVHPSYYDAFGLVGLEAMACGLPLVLSRQCGVSEIADERGAVRVDVPCAREALADAVYAAAEPAFRRAARAANWEHARRFPLEANYRNVLALYAEVAAGPGERG
jgi:UDP-glucose:(heptosyl)LPS alpha-1,3-glucosyltransferase